ncbi:hypothetical protein Scep_019383 [Stephania cephalantha]|uniref:Uncharacterized protein n=1 Tax=Stephania cephalantha TaxID=152367 RepID=A0AAP0NMV2_9MAGN
MNGKGLPGNGFRPFILSKPEFYLGHHCLVRVGSSVKLEFSNPKIFNSIITYNQGLMETNYGLGRELGAEDRLKRFHKMVGHFAEITKDHIGGMTCATVMISFDPTDPSKRRAHKRILSEGEAIGCSGSGSQTISSDVRILILTSNCGVET